MEPLGYLVVMLAFSAGKAFINSGIAGDLIDTVWGGAIEELLEWLTKKLTPNAWIYSRKGGLRKELFLDIVRYVQELDEEEKKELSEFLDSIAAEDKKNKGGSVGVWSDIFLDDSIVNPPENTDKKAHKEYVRSLNKRLDKVKDFIKKTTDEVGKMQDLGIGYIGVKEMTNKVFGKDVASVPASAVRIVSMVNDYFFELKYLGLSDDEKNLTKVVQKMMEDGNLRLLDSIRKEFDLRIQFSNNPGVTVTERTEGGVSFKESNISKLAKTDPYLFVRLECPVCHSSGSEIVRNGDHAFCKACHESFEIIRNVKEFEDVLKETEARLAAGIRQSNEEMKAAVAGTGAEIKGELGDIKKLAAAIVNNQYMQMSELREEIGSGNEAVVLSLSVRLLEMKESLRERTDAAALKLLSEMKRDNAAIISEIRRQGKDTAEAVRELERGFAATFERALDGQREESKRMLSEIDGRLDLMRDAMERRADDVKETVKLGNDIVIKELKEHTDDRFGQVGYMLNDVKRHIDDVLENQNNVPKKESAIRRCPLCLNLERRFVSSGEHYVCDTCGFTVEKGMMEVDRDRLCGHDIELVVKGNGNGGSQLGFKERPSFDEEREDTFYRVWIVSGVAPVLGGRNPEFGSYLRLSFDPYEATQIVLVDNNPCTLKEQHIKNLLNGFSRNSLWLIALGNNVEYCGDAVIEDGRCCWVYDRDKKKFTKSRR